MAHNTCLAYLYFTFGIRFWRTHLGLFICYCRAGMNSLKGTFFGSTSDGVTSEVDRSSSITTSTDSLRPASMYHHLYNSFRCHIYLTTRSCSFASPPHDRGMAKWLLHPNPWGRLTYPMNRPCTILLIDCKLITLSPTSTTNNIPLYWHLATCTPQERIGRRCLWGWQVK